MGPEALPGSGSGWRQGRRRPPTASGGLWRGGYGHRELGILPRTVDSYTRAALCPAVTGGPGAPSSNSLVPDASLTQPGHELDRQHDVARRERDWQHPLRSCQSLHTESDESTLRPPTCGHRPFLSRAASSGHGLPKCGWPASLQSPATPEEVDGIRQLGGQ